MKKFNGTFYKKLKESAVSTIPITLIVIILNFATIPMDSKNLISFIIGSLFLIIGMCLYTLGVDTALTPIGSYIGSKITKSKNLFYILLMSFVLGVIVTVAEPDLSVLQSQTGISFLTYAIAIGVGLFMLIAVLRIVFRIKLKYLLLILYAILFLFVGFANAYPNIIPLSFDSGGVTTGPITVPFIIALSAGITGVLGGGGKDDSNFGTIGICSVGPILIVLIIGLILKINPSSDVSSELVYSSYGEMIKSFISAMPHYLLEVCIALGPIIIFFVFFQFFSLKLPRKQIIKLTFGILYVIVGLTFFFTGVNIGFMPTGHYIGGALAKFNKWMMIPVGMFVGLFIVFAEPAVHILAKQVSDVTNGTIKRRTMLFTLALAMALAIGLAMLRVITGINIIWFLAIGYGLSIILMFYVPSIFTGIAFDSGGVASGPMTATFMLPFAAGASAQLNGGSSGETFGVVAMVAMTPLLAVQIIGLIYNIKSHKARRIASRAFKEMLEREGNIIDMSTYCLVKNDKLSLDEIDAKIAIIKEEIKTLKGDLSIKRSELYRLIKMRNEIKKEGTINAE